MSSPKHQSCLTFRCDTQESKVESSGASIELPSHFNATDSKAKVGSLGDRTKVRGEEPGHSVGVNVAWIGGFLWRRLPWSEIRKRSLSGDDVVIGLIGHRFVQ
jgi:hypothetical protein